MRKKGRFKILTGVDEDSVLLGCCAISTGKYE
jgi:hypothetical protein